MEEYEKPKPHLFEVKRWDKYYWIVDITLLVEADERVQYVVYSASKYLQVGDVFWATLRWMEKGLYLEHIEATYLETCFKLPVYLKT
jgi:hypothetical protein